MAWEYETREKERLLVFKIQWRHDKTSQDSFTFVCVFFPQYSAMKIPGQGTQASHTILKGFHVVVLTVTSVTVILLLPSSTVLDKHKIVKEEGERGKDAYAGS